MLHGELVLLLHHEVLPLDVGIVDLDLDGALLLLDLLRESHLLGEALGLLRLLQRLFEQRLVVLLISELEKAVVAALRDLEFDLADDPVIDDVLLLVLGDAVQLVDLLLVLRNHLVLLLHVALELVQDVLVVLGQLHRLQLLLHARRLLRVEAVLEVGLGVQVDVVQVALELLLLLLGKGRHDYLNDYDHLSH